MQKEDYVSLEVAKMLKEKEYPQEYDVGVVCRLQNKVNHDYENTRAITDSDLENAWCIFNEIYPTLYEAQKWLRDCKGINIEVCLFGTFIEENNYEIDNMRHYWGYKIYETKDITFYIDSENEEYSCYEEALNAGILEALKMI